MARRFRKLPCGTRALVVVQDGIEGFIGKWTELCSGCTEWGDYGQARGPFGCDECGYTGKRRREMWMPFDALDYGDADSQGSGEGRG